MHNGFMFVICLYCDLFTMSSLSERAKAHGFVIADLFGRSLSLLDASDYRYILQCSSMQEITIRLSRVYPTLNEEVSLSTKEVEGRLVQSIKSEIYELSSGDCESSGRAFFIGFFVQYHRIQCFFRRLVVTLSGTSDSMSDSTHLGDFPELRGLKYCKTFDDIKKFVLKNSGIEGFFENIGVSNNLEANDLQVAYLHVMKNYYDHYCSCYKCFGDGSEYFEEILKVEVDAFVLELCMGGDPFPYIPSTYSLPNLNLNNLSRTFGLDSENTQSFHTASDSVNGSLTAKMIERQARVYQDSFRSFNDISCVYAYLKLKEHEMRKVLFAIESSLNND